jgi:hypothetical protein
VVQNASLSAVKSRIARGRTRLAHLLGATPENAAGRSTERAAITGPDLSASGQTLFST